MKKYIKHLVLLTAFVSMLTSCEEDTVTYNGKNFVSLNSVASTRLNFRENAGTSEIPVNIAFARSTDLVVNYTLTSEVAQTGVHYNDLTGGSVTIPAGETSANIRIQVIDNEDIDASKPLFLTLTDVSDSDVSLGLTDRGSIYKRFLIVNNDCTTNFDIWVGALKITMDAAVTDATGDFNEDGECNILLVDGVLHPNGAPDAPITFTFTPSSPNSPTGTIVALEQIYQAGGYTQAGVAYDIKYSATGTYNETTKTINIVSKNFISLGSFEDANVTIRPAQ